MSVIFFEYYLIFYVHFLFFDWINVLNVSTIFRSELMQFDNFLHPKNIPSVLAYVALKDFKFKVFNPEQW